MKKTKKTKKVELKKISKMLNLKELQTLSGGRPSCGATEALFKDEGRKGD
jgi:hypothetical protein